MDPFILKEAQGIQYFSLEMLEKRGISFAFTTKIKGVVPTLEPESKLRGRGKEGRSWEILLDHLNIPLKSLVAGEQVHGDRVEVAHAIHKGAVIPRADALITEEKGVALLSLYADCLPLVLYDTKNQVIALSHAGWRGSLSSIGPKTLLVMKSLFSTEEESLWVFMGPSIHPCCYQVGWEVYELFRETFPHLYDGCFLEREGHLYFDLKEVNRRQLLKVGVLENAIFTSSLCTSCYKELFYSFRRDGRIAGRMASLIYRAP